MAAPMSYPVWMVKSGAPDMQVNDLLSYQNALVAGYAYNLTTPVMTIVSLSSVTETVIDDPLSAAQSDPGQQDQIS